MRQLPNERRRREEAGKEIIDLRILE